MKVFLNESGCLLLDHSEFKNFSIHPLWLRERLNSEKYLDQNNYQRLYEPSLLDSNIKFSKFFVENNYLKVEFTDNSKGQFSIEDLINNLYSKDIIPNKKSWKNNFKNLPIYDFKLLNNREYFKKLLCEFQKLGFIIVKNTSVEEGSVIKFAEMFGPVRTTNFGKHFDVVSKPNPNDLAYTSLGIKAHTDNPYRKPMPGIQILHCISNEADGGDSSLVDGFAVAEYLKINETEMYKMLTETDVLFKFVDKDIILELSLIHI